MNTNWLDMQHRGFSAYLKETGDADICKEFHRAILCTDTEGEQIDTVLCDCEVKMDWIEQIEEALPFIENAIRENRQFILRQGETVLIEKAKRVSKASVEHLSRHSELITTIPAQGEDLIPEKIYMTENTGTYAVYENRFLYMLLCYLRDFAGFRYKKILELAASFSAEVSFTKDFTNGPRKIKYALNYSETAQGEDGVCQSRAQDAICRIETILQTVEVLLRTDLMKEVSATPMLKPPIVRTNALLHNPNFKVAFALYSFLTAYTQEGYEKIERYRSNGDFSTAMREDFAALVAITSYLSYSHGGLKEELEARFLEEERQRAEAEEAARQEKIQALKEKLGEIDGAAFDYIIALEERCAGLEKKITLLSEQETLRVEAETRLEESLQQKRQLEGENDALAAALGEKYNEIQWLSQENARALAEADLRLQQEKAQQEERAQQFAAELAQQKQEFLQAYEALAEQYRLANARNHALLEQQGKNDLEDTVYTKETFAQLEAEYTAFKRFFETQWKQAKKQIRHQQLWKKVKK